ncbi:MAG TPA: hypothetical protein EYG38_17210 [Verrucomicrobia bacterium]|nr:hypothetical protein [Verrucomicrobiota bacterium]
MPSKEYQIQLREDVYIVVEFAMVTGRIVSFVVRLMYATDGNDVNVARYDTAHGTPHRDDLGKKGGLLAKTWYFEAELSQVLRQAVDDFKENYEGYIRSYFKN